MVSRTPSARTATGLAAGLALALAADLASASAPAWRIDFDGAAHDTLAASNFWGWTVAADSRTQSVALAAGGPAGSNPVVRLLGADGATWSVFQRTMNAGAATNLYRDGLQCGGRLTVSISNLQPGRTHRIRLWYFDDEFTIGSTQSYVDVTGGGAAPLGALTNVPSANLAAGHAALPQGLYDARYSLAFELAASALGECAVEITPGAGNAKLNALEIVGLATPPAVTYSGVEFTEAAANDGSIGSTIELHLTDAEWGGADGDEFIAAGRSVAGPVPAGLQAALTRSNATTLVFALSGQAQSHAAADGVTNLSLTLLDSAFLNVAASNVLGAARSDLRVVFSDPTNAAPMTRIPLNWSSVPGNLYAVEYGNRPEGPFAVAVSHVPADLASTSFTASVPAGAVSPLLLRIRVE